MNIAFASNWERSYSNTYGGDNITYYFDTTSVQRSSDGKNFYFWTAQVYDYQHDKNNPTKEIWFYNEVTIASPHYRRNIEDYGYAANHNEIWHNTKTSEWLYVQPGSPNDNMINAAHRYLK